MADKILKKLTILKLGGGLLTDKSQPHTIRNETLKNVVKEIKTCMDLGLIEDLIIIHGVGSIGHPPVLKHKLHYGFQGTNQLIPLSQTQLAVNRFRNQIAEECANAGLPVNLLHSSSICIAEKMQIKVFFMEAIKGFMSVGMIPLLGGDMVSDRKMGFSVGSGDHIAALLAEKLHAHHLIFATDVDGVYRGNPKIHPESEFLSKINLKDLNSIFSSEDSSKGSDASGMMKGKIKSLLPLMSQIEAGLKVSVLSMLPKDNLLQLLQGKLTRYTKIVGN